MVSGMGSRYIVAAGHPATAQAAGYALESGGNAFDGALAGWLASCLAEPVLTSPGGGGFAMVAPASSQPRLYDFFTQTPRTANPDGHTFPLEADFGSTRQVFHLGAGSIATPGCVAGILRMHADFGKLPFSECAAPARQISRDGLKITSHAATLLEVVNDLYRATPEALELFQSKINPGQCLMQDEVFENRDFGDFLDMLESEGARWFYEGDIGRIVSDYCRNHDGHLTREDFLNYKIEIREPLKIRRNGATILLNPPPSMGGILVALGLLIGKPNITAGYPNLDRAGWYEWIRPLKLMSELRTPEGMARLSDDDLSAIKQIMSQNPQINAAVESLFPHALSQLHARGTTQLSIMDREGNEISMTTSNGSGSAIIPKGTGFMLNNMLGEEDLQPEGLNTWKPDQRLASMMAPTLAHLSDGSRLATGSGGSNRIRSTILQILRHVIDNRSGLEEAINAPRLHWESHQLHAESVAAEVLDSLPDSVEWPVIEHSIPNLFFGGAHSVIGHKNGSFHGQGDPRRGGTTIHG